MVSTLITDIVAGLFPPGSALVERAGEVPPDSRFYVIPGKEGPRWIVPWQAWRSRGALSLWRPYNPVSRLRWAALTAAYRAGLLHSAPGVTAFGVTLAGAWAHLGWPDEPPTPTIYVGTPGPTRKAVAFLTSPGAKRPVSVAKLPLGRQAGPAILREAEVLKRLAGEKPGLAPRVLFVDREGGRAVQEVVRGRPSGRRFKPAYLRWLVGLRREGAATSLRSQATRLAEEITRICVPAQGADDVLRRLAKLDDPRSLPAIWTHGDFAPWNLRLVEGGGLAAVDWERASPDGPPLYDLVHFYLIQDFMFGSCQLGARRYRRMARRYLEALGVKPGLYDPLLELALVKSWVSATETGGEAGAAFAAECLERLVTR